MVVLAVVVLGAADWWSYCLSAFLLYRADAGFVPCRHWNMSSFLLLEIMLTSSLMRLEDWLSWPSSSKRSTCSSNSLSRVINVVCLFNIDDAVLWCVCCLIISSESLLSSASWPLILLIIKDNDRKLLFCSTVFSRRSSSFFIDISVALNILMANWHSALFCFDILVAVALLKLTVEAVGEAARYWRWRTALRTGATQIFDLKKRCLRFEC